MKKKLTKLTGCAVLALLAAGLALAGCTSSPATTTPTTSVSPTPTTTQPTTTPPTTPYTINVATSAAIGQYLTDNRGFTLYWTALDSPGSSNLTPEQLVIWPPFYTATISVPSSLNAGDFDTYRRTDGKSQTTYKNWPLYYYSGDNRSGQTNGQGILGKWFAVSPNATGPVAVTPTTTPPSTSPTTTTPSTTPPATTTAPPTTSPSSTPTTTAPPTTTVPTVTVNLVAHNIAFNLSTITVPAGAQVIVNFDNQDVSVPHNFAVYTNSSATTPIFVGQIITGPATITYRFTAPTTPGNYFFRCDVHPTIMFGTFVVQ